MLISCDILNNQGEVIIIEKNEGIKHLKKKFLLEKLLTMLSLKIVCFKGFISNKMKII